VVEHEDAIEADGFGSAGDRDRRLGVFAELRKRDAQPHTRRGYGCAVSRSVEAAEIDDPAGARTNRDRLHAAQGVAQHHGDDK